jgi:hypothetical protein
MHYLHVQGTLVGVCLDSWIMNPEKMRSEFGKLVYM